MELTFNNLPDKNIIPLVDDCASNIKWNPLYGKWYPYGTRDFDGASYSKMEEVETKATKIYAIMPYINDGLLCGNCVYEGWKFFDYSHRKFIFTYKKSVFAYIDMWSHYVSAEDAQLDPSCKNFRMFTTKEEAIANLNVWKTNHKDEFLTKLTDISELTVGTEFHIVEGDKVETYEFLCIHPHNDKYVLAIKNITQDASKLYIPTLLNSEVYVGRYNDNFFCNLRMEYLKKEIDDLRKQMEE